MFMRVAQTLFILLFFSALGIAQTAGREALGGQMAKIALEAKGRVGVSLELLEGRESLTLLGEQQFPMQSVYKFPIGMAVLNQVDQGRLKLDQQIQVEKSELVPPGFHSPIRDSHPQGGVVSLRELLRYSVSESDGTACDVLLRVVGGADVVTRYLRSLGIKGVKVATTEREMAVSEFVQYRNWAKPQSMTALLRALHEGKGLSPSSRELLLRLMIETPTGPRRLKGLLPDGTVVAHKTGTSGTRKGLTRATNDVGLITLPDGRHLAIAVFVSDSRASQEVRESVIARIARAAWDHWSPTSKVSTRREFPIGSYLEGEFIVSFGADGSFIVQNEAVVKARGKYTVEGERIVFLEAGAIAECSEAGQYTWKLVHDSLKFTRLEDRCRGREYHLTSRKWLAIR
jgi:beta-lactamase class A